MEIELWVKKVVLPMFERGKKLEVRTRNRFMSSIKIGDKLVFNRAVARTVKAIRRYRNFNEMLGCEKAEEIWPGATAEEILKFLREIYPPMLENMGVIIFEL